VTVCSTLALVLIAQMTPAPPPASPATPAPLASPTASGLPGSPEPVPSTTLVPAASPGPSATATESATPSPYTYRFVPRQPAHPVPGAPQIFMVYLNGKTLHSLGPILIKVVTDPATVKVTSRSNGQEGIIPMIAPGDFEAASKLPKIPFIAAGMTIQLEFVATSASGLKTVVRVPVALQ
jgi:hypothetical protein